MAANTATLEHGDHGGFFGRSFVRLTIAALMAVLVLGVISDAASARPATTSMGQNEFVGKCRAGGGTTKRLAPRVVQCTTGSGEVVICDFNTSPASCIISLAPQQGGAWVPVTGGVLEQVDAEPSGPAVHPGHVAPVRGGVVQQVESAPTVSDTTATTSGTFQPIDAVAVATEEPAPSPAPESPPAPLPGGMVTAGPAVVELDEDERS